MIESYHPPGFSNGANETMKCKRSPIRQKDEDENAGESDSFSTGFQDVTHKLLARFGHRSSEPTARKDIYTEITRVHSFPKNSGLYHLLSSDIESETVDEVETVGSEEPTAARTSSLKVTDASDLERVPKAVERAVSHVGLCPISAISARGETRPYIEYTHSYRFLDTLSEVEAPAPQGRTAVHDYDSVYPLSTNRTAQVYVARLKGIGGFERLVALKVIHPHLVNNQANINMVIDKARLAGVVHHPNVGKLLEVGEDNGRYFMARELVVGQNMQELMTILFERELIQHHVKIFRSRAAGYSSRQCESLNPIYPTHESPAIFVVPGHEPAPSKKTRNAAKTEVRQIKNRWPGQWHLIRRAESRLGGARNWPQFRLRPYFSKESMLMGGCFLLALLLLSFYTLFLVHIGAGHRDTSNKVNVVNQNSPMTNTNSKASDSAEAPQQRRRADT